MTLEQNMRSIFEGRINNLKNIMYTGETVMGSLPNSGKIVKIRLNDARTRGHYESVVVVVIDNASKERADYQEFRFYDTWGKLQTTNPNFRDGVMPHIWDEGYGREVGWYVVKPNAQQVNALVDKINCYISYFA